MKFSSFPWSSKERLEEWLAVVPSKNKIGKYSYICSVHFDESDFVKFGINRTLKKTTVPCYFPNNDPSIVSDTRLIISNFTYIVYIFVDLFIVMLQIESSCINEEQHSSVSLSTSSNSSVPRDPKSIPEAQQLLIAATISPNNTTLSLMPTTATILQKVPVNSTAENVSLITETSKIKVNAKFYVSNIKFENQI